MSKDRIWTTPFTLAVAATTSVFVGFYSLLPALPVYASRLGASKFEVGLVIAIYSLSAIPARLLTGPLMDRHGRKRFLLAGLGLFGILSALYPLAESPAALMLVRSLHGLSWGCLTTAMSTLVADIVPGPRRGEALGYWGLAPTLAMAVGPLAAGLLVAASDFGTVFAGAAAFGILAALLIVPVGEPARHLAPPGSTPARVGRPPREALLPASVLYLSSLSYGALVAFLPVALAERPRETGLFFSLYAATILVARPVAGRLSDRWGRPAVILPGLALGAAGCLLLGSARNVAALGAAAILYGAGIGGGGFPGLLALTVDRSPVSSRGAALAGFFTAYDLAIASGSGLLGTVYETRGFGAVNLVAAAGIIASLVVLVLGLRLEAGGSHARGVA